MIYSGAPRKHVLRRGNGYLSGSFPAGITSLDGVPTPATVRVLLRDTREPYLVAETVSAVDGTWRVEGLPLDRRYDVVCRMEGFNDLVLSNVTPAPY